MSTVFRLVRHTSFCSTIKQVSDALVTWCVTKTHFWLLVVYLFSAYISTGQIMGWGNKAIEIRSAETGHLDGVFMHKKAQKLKFLCERNDKVIFGLRFHCFRLYL